MMRYPLFLFLFLILAPFPIPAEAADSLPVIESQILAQRTRPDAAQFAHAVSEVELAVKTTPDNAQAWVLLTWVRMIEHRFNDALVAVQRAKNLAPDHPRMLALMSDALVELGRYDEAANMTQHLVDVAPGIPAWTRAAHLRFLLDDLDGAIEIMGMAARAGAQNGEASAWVWLDLARLYLDAGNPQAASGAVATAERAAPGLAATRSIEARLKLVQGDARAALALSRQALAIQPSAEAALTAWRIARQLKDAGMEKHLAALLEGFAKLDRERSRRALAEYFSDSGQLKLALECAREEHAARPDLYSEATLARALQRAGDASEAQRHARAALALNTPDPQLQSDMHAILLSGAVATRP
jgi:tetratricopeptide (TPR) repeat protein